jgi:hypothetical protein
VPWVPRGSYAWWAVVFHSPPSLRPRRPISTHSPPYEQWLIGVGAGVVSFGAVLW